MQQEAIHSVSQLDRNTNQIYNTCGIYKTYSTHKTKLQLLLLYTVVAVAGVVAVAVTIAIGLGMLLVLVCYELAWV